jgi:LPS export ABC transporter protein LptC
MKKSAKNALLGAIVVVFVLFFQTESTAQVNAAEFEEKIQQQIFSFNLEGYTDEGKKKWEIAGQSADVGQENVALKDITAKIYGEEGTLTLRADTGIYNKLKKDVKLAENVVATASDGTKLTTDSLNWNQQTQAITTKDKIVLERKEVKISGSDAIAHPKLKTVSLKKQATVEMEPSTVITCEGSLEFDYEQAQAVFNDNVKVVDQRGQIFADKITAYLDKAKKSVSKVVAEGNVKIQRGKSHTFSEKAVYDANDGSVSLTGKPKLILYQEKDMDINLPEGVGQ